MTTDTALITRISHRITPDKWVMDLGFSDTTTVAPPQSTPTPTGGTFSAGSTAATDPGTQAGNVVVVTNNDGQATIAFPRPYQGSPVVVATGGNGEFLWIVPNPTTSGFTVAAFDFGSRAAIRNNNIRVFWIANRATQ